MEKIFEQLNKAKDNVIWLATHTGSADMHDLVYWAKEVERLRTVLREAINE